MKLSQRFKRALETELNRLVEQQSNPSTSDGKNRIARRRARRRRAAQVRNPAPALQRHRGRAVEQMGEYTAFQGKLAGLLQNRQAPVDKMQSLELLVNAMVRDPRYKKDRTAILRKVKALDPIGATPQQVQRAIKDIRAIAKSSTEAQGRAGERMGEAKRAKFKRGQVVTGASWYRMIPPFLKLDKFKILKTIKQGGRGRGPIEFRHYVQVEGDPNRTNVKGWLDEEVLERA